MPTRREILTAMLGAPLALAACHNAPPPLPPGELVGPTVSFGHRLRDGLTVKPEQWHDIDGVIVGGGVAGLSAAWKLRQRGAQDFALLELEPQAGGTSRSGTSPVVGYPWGAHYLPAPLAENHELIALLEEMKVLEGRAADGTPIVAEQYLCRDPDERVFYKGRWYEGLYLKAGASAEDFRQLEAFEREIDRWVSWRDEEGRKAFSLPLARSSNSPVVTALDRQSMEDWLNQHGFTSARLRWFVDYGCRDDYGMTISQTSAWAALFYFASRRKQPGEDSQPFITWPEGNGRLVNHLLSRCREQVQVDLAVTDISPLSTDPANSQRVEVIATNAAGDRVVGYRAKWVIYAAPQFLARYLIRPWRKSPPAHLAEFQYGSWMVANLFIRDRPQSTGFASSWDNVLYDSPSLGYVVATHQKLLDHGPTVWTYYYPLCDSDPKQARQRLLGLGRDHWADVALSDLAIAHPNLRKLVERIDIMRWGHAMVRPRPGFIWSQARQQAAQPFGNIHFAHTDLSGVALFEEAFHHGLRAADEVLGKS